MDSTQKFLGDSLLVQIDVEVDRYLTNKHDKIRWDIIEVLHAMKYPGDDYMIDTFAFVVHGSDKDYFFVADMLFETPDSLFVLDIRETDSDTFLDYMIKKQYINYGL